MGYEYLDGLAGIKHGLEGLIAIKIDDGKKIAGE